MMRTGSLVGLCYRFSEEITAGTASITATINGVATALSAAVATGNQVGVATALEDEIPYEAGDLVGVIITTSGTFAPVTTDLEVWMQAQEDE
jgi:translation initiation factor 2 gamma subunit (eIF-2gamma)